MKHLDETPGREWEGCKEFLGYVQKAITFVMVLILAEQHEESSKKK